MIIQDNAWCKITPEQYDAHMSHLAVAQTQALNRITREQLELLPVERRPGSTAAILGITNGNGLEHVLPLDIGAVIGIDINEPFLDECRARYPEVRQRLRLYALDLTRDTDEASALLSGCDLIIANLLIKHIGLDIFMRIVDGLPRHGQIVSCVIQVDPDGTALSHSGYEHVFTGVSRQRADESEASVVPAMETAGFAPTGRFVYDLPNGKQFVRMDFAAQ